MSIKFLLPILLFISAPLFAETTHYVLNDNKHVHHLKITKLADRIRVSADVDFEANASEGDQHACSADIAGEAKEEKDKVLVLKKQMEGERHFCTLNIKLSDSGATIEQSKDCSYFAAGICHFDSDGKELVKIK